MMFGCVRVGFCAGGWILVVDVWCYTYTYLYYLITIIIYYILYYTLLPFSYSPSSLSFPSIKGILIYKKNPISSILKLITILLFGLERYLIFFWIPFIDLSFLFYSVPFLFCSMLSLNPHPLSSVLG